MISLDSFDPTYLLDPHLCFQLTITLLHVLWQGTVIAAVVVVANWCLRGSAARMRYTVGVAAMLLMVACLPVTLAILHLTPSGTALPLESVARLDPTEHFVDDLAPQLAGSDASRASLKRDSTFDGAHSNAVPNDLPPALGDDDMMVAVVASHDQSDGSLALMRFSPYATIAYLLGVAFMMLRLGIALWSGRRLCHRVAITEEQHLLAIVRRRAGAIGMKVLPTVAYCKRIAVPVVVGIVKPTIVFPATLLTGLEPRQLEAIITHELAHVLRFDLLVNLFQRVVESLLFFHPAVWFISHRVSVERENCCDDLVVSAGHERLEYAGALIRMAELCGKLRGNDKAANLAALAATGDNPSQFKRRVMRLLDSDPRMHLTRGGMICALTLLVLLVASPIVVRRSQTRAAADDQPIATTSDDPKGEAKPDDKSKEERTPWQIALDRKRATDELARLLEDENFTKVVTRFSDELQQTLTAEKLTNLWQELDSKHGKLRDVDTEGLHPFGVAELSLIELECAQTTLKMWVDFDDDDHIAGIWIDDSEGEYLSNNSQIAFRYGQRISEIAGWNLTLEAKVLDLQGEPAQQCIVQFYREVAADEAGQERDWNDPTTKRRWRQFAFQQGDAPATATRLKPGLYRALVRTSTSYRAPLGMSPPIRLVKSLRKQSVTVRVQPGGTVRITPTNAQDDTALSRAVTKLIRKDTAWPPLTLYPQKEGDVLSYENLPPGKYSISASRRADRYDGLRYETVDDVEVEIAVGATREVRLALQGRSLTEEEKNARAPWIAMGRVTDADGNPIASVEIWASAGWGSLRGATLATTDENGRYRGRFAQSGFRAMDFDSDALNLVSGQVGAYKDGMYEANLNQQGGMHAAFRRPQPGEEVPDYIDTDRLFIRGQPREVNFVLLPAAEVVVQVLDTEDRPLGTKRISLDGKELPPASSVIAQGTTEASGKFTFSKVPVGYAWWLEVKLPERRYARSMPMKFAAQKYEVVLKHSVEELTGFDRLVLVRAQDAAGNDVKDQLIADDPYLRPPVEAALQEKGRDILRRVREVNRYWLTRPVDEVKRYAYDFIMPDNKPQSITIDNPATGSIYQRRGISYYSAIDYVTANPDKVVFRVVDVGDEQIELVYALKESIRVSAGNGVAGTWGGFFSMGVRQGTLIIDATTHTVSEHRSGELAERLSNYFEIRAGHYVPLRIQISKYQLDWVFKVHSPGLWLFDKGTRDGKADEFVVRVEKVSINGQAVASDKDNAGTGAEKNRVARADEFPEEAFLSARLCQKT